MLPCLSVLTNCPCSSGRSPCDVLARDDSTELSPLPRSSGCCRFLCSLFIFMVFWFLLLSSCRCFPLCGLNVPVPWLILNRKRGFVLIWTHLLAQAMGTRREARPHDRDIMGENLMPDMSGRPRLVCGHRGTPSSGGTRRPHTSRLPLHARTVPGEEHAAIRQLALPTLQRLPKDFRLHSNKQDSQGWHSTKIGPKRVLAQHT